MLRFRVQLLGSRVEPRGFRASGFGAGGLGLSVSEVIVPSLSEHIDLGLRCLVSSSTLQDLCIVLFGRGRRVRA